MFHSWSWNSSWLLNGNKPVSFAAKPLPVTLKTNLSFCWDIGNSCSRMVRCCSAGICVSSTRACPAGPGEITWALVLLSSLPVVCQHLHDPLPSVHVKLCIKHLPVPWIPLCHPCICQTSFSQLFESLHVLWGKSCSKHHMWGFLSLPPALPEAWTQTPSAPAVPLSWAGGTGELL